MQYRIVRDIRLLSHRWELIWMGKTISFPLRLHHFYFIFLLCCRMANQSNINRIVPPLASMTTFHDHCAWVLALSRCSWKMKSSWYYKCVGLHALHIWVHPHSDCMMLQSSFFSQDSTFLFLFNPHAIMA